MPPRSSREAPGIPHETTIGAAISSAPAVAFGFGEQAKPPQPGRGLMEFFSK